jgi:predicted  nucleic acid-binding Zn-ribbon protein
VKGRKQDLKAKNEELKTLTEETQIEEDKLLKDRKKAEKNIDERYINAYSRVRTAYRNGVAVAKIERDSCSGCFAQVPPQRQIDIKQRRKITVCENCGRILIDAQLAEDIAR